MEYEIVTLPQKIITGISTATSNADPQVGQIISNLWQTFMAGNLAQNIGNIASPYPLCLYSDYLDTTVPGYRLAYQLTLGYEVSTNEKTDVYTQKILPASQYAKFCVQGNITTAAAKAWAQI